jgi:hypothetical protein
MLVLTNEFGSNAGVARAHRATPSIAIGTSHRRDPPYYPYPYYYGGYYAPVSFNVGFGFFPGRGFFFPGRGFFHRGFVHGGFHGFHGFHGHH